MISYPAKCIIRSTLFILIIFTLVACNSSKEHQLGHTKELLNGIETSDASLYVRSELELINEHILELEGKSDSRASSRKTLNVKEIQREIEDIRELYYDRKQAALDASETFFQSVAMKFDTISLFIELLPDKSYADQNNVIRAHVKEKKLREKVKHLKGQLDDGQFPEVLQKATELANDIDELLQSLRLQSVTRPQFATNS